MQALWRFLIVCSLSLAALGHAHAQTGDPASLQFFETRVRPVLAEHCYSCHGAERQRSDLRVDHIIALQKGGETGAALIPGDGEKSLLLEAIRYTNVDLQMPPSGRLPEAAIADIEAWINAGAVWPEEPFTEGQQEEEAFDLQARRAQHWAWQPVANPAVPEVGEGWALGAVDRFIAEGHAQQGLRPAKPADRATLLRRLYFDLVGFPPSPESIEAFVNDSSHDAYEKQVDALLASEHFGERWGRHWLDITRFAETYGHEGDYTVHHAWRYRDYVIRAFNDDIPIDQMIREHIAGDLPPLERINPESGLNEAVQATAFWYMHQATHAPVDVRLDHAERIDNQIDVMSKAFMAMTVSCARCHDHKFDAVSIEDYYALSGILRSSRPREALLDPHNAIAEGLPEIRDALPRGERLLNQALHHVDERQRIRDYILAGEAVAQGADPASTAQVWNLDPDHLTRWSAALQNAPKDNPRHVLALWQERTGRLEGGPALGLDDLPPPAAASESEASNLILFEDFSGALEGWQFEGQAFGDGPLPEPAWFPGADGPRLSPGKLVHSGRYGNELEGVLRSPVFSLDHEHIHLRVAGRGGQIRLIIENYILRDQNGLLFGGTGKDINHGEDFQWVSMHSDLSKFVGARAYFEFRDLGPGFLAVDEILFSSSPLPAHMAHPRLEAEGQGLPELAAWFETQFLDAATQWQARNPGFNDVARLDFLLHNNLVAHTTAPDRLKSYGLELAAQARALPKPVRVTAIAEATPYDQPVFIRGNHKTPGDVAKRRFLEAIDTPISAFDDGSGRLALAEAVTHPANPLTARVMVNRVWHYLFATGLVPTVDDFGDMGLEPSHPELLDFLARRFMEEGWSAKGLIRDLVLSQTYRMESVAALPEQDETDPTNTFLHRMPRKRLEAEAIRDAILVTAGAIDASLYGPSVPAWISPHMGGFRKPDVSGPMDGDRRRSIYLEVRRNYLSPMLTTFDFPLPDTTHGKRNVSNVPAQALILMNDPFVVEQAGRWAERLRSEVDTVTARIERAYLEALGRTPHAEEMARAQAFLDNHAQALEDDAALWADFCHVLFMTKEFIFIG